MSFPVDSAAVAVIGLPARTRAGNAIRDAITVIFIAPDSYQFNCGLGCRSGGHPIGIDAEWRGKSLAMLAKCWKPLASNCRSGIAAQPVRPRWCRLNITQGEATME